MRRLQRLRNGLTLCLQRIDAPGWWIPLCTSVPTRVVTIAAGWGWAVYAPMAIPIAAPGGSCTAPRARAVACLENFSRHRRCHWFKMHTISQVLNPSGEPINGELPPPFVKIVGPQFAVRFLTGEHMKSTDHHRVCHGDDGSLLPTAYCETVIQRREIGVLGPHGRMRQLGQDGSQGAIALTGFARASLA